MSAHFNVLLKLQKIHKPACLVGQLFLLVHVPQKSRQGDPALFVRRLNSYVKDSTHMLNILDYFRFNSDGEHHLVITMDNKSLYSQSQ